MQDWNCVDDAVPSDAHWDDAGGVSHSSSIRLEASSAAGNDVPHTFSLAHHPSPICDIDSLNQRNELPGNDVVQQNKHMSISPTLKSRLREKRHTDHTKHPATADQKQDSSKPGRPVVFATTQRPVIKKKVSVVARPSKSPKHNIQDLVRASQKDVKSVAPVVRS
jgi:hypothetical protein